MVPVPLRGSVRTVGQFACYQVGPWAGQDLEYCTTELLWHSETCNHYLYPPMQFVAEKNEIFVFIFAQNID